MDTNVQRYGPTARPANDLGEEVDRLSRAAQAQASELGGGWRLEQGVMPVVVLTTVEADRLIRRLHEAESAKRLLKGMVEDVDRIYGTTITVPQQ